LWRRLLKDGHGFGAVSQEIGTHRQSEAGRRLSDVIDACVTKIFPVLLASNRIARDCRSETRDLQSGRCRKSRDKCHNDIEKARQAMANVTNPIRICRHLCHPEAFKDNWINRQ
jgi:hypothetical protein